MKQQIKYREGYKYQLHADATIQTMILGAAARIEPWVYLEQNGILTVKFGYAWDGPSGPTWDDLGAVGPDHGGPGVRGSLYHDALYQLMREGHLEQSWRKRADELLYECCREDGMNEVRAEVWERAVREFAASSAARQRPIIKVAP